eukprot:TRINITY_DN24604_c0_g1_i1.p1 TRINITY_DN24604_c0_g1~~TRINITY_DN24604_c0_g1_i1.p1  ORF type:complete len:362 (+),score=69.42 TRINITY_DN24604_c0_g1_i1:151-1086(+)
MSKLSPTVPSQDVGANNTAKGISIPEGGTGTGTGAGAGMKWVPRFGFQSAMQRVQAAMRIQSLFRGQRDRVVVGNFKTKRLTFFHARDPRIRDIWTQVAHNRQTSTSMTLLDTVHTLLTTKVTSNYVADTEGEEKESFTNFLFSFYQTSLGSVEEATKTISDLLVGLSNHLSTDIIFSIITNLILNIWDVSYCDLLCSALRSVQSLLTKSGGTSLVNPAIVFDQNVSLSQQQVRALVKSLFSETTAKRAAATSDAVVAKCKILEGRRSGKTRTQSNSKVFITQNEFYYSLLVTASPDALAECGYGSINTPD